MINKQIIRQITILSRIDNEKTEKNDEEKGENKNNNNNGFFSSLKYQNY